MRILVITEIDLATGDYEVSFKNKSDPGASMDLNEIRTALRKVTDDFLGDNPKETGPKQYLA